MGCQVPVGFDHHSMSARRGFSLYLCLRPQIVLPMKKSLAHLPKHKRDELKVVKEIILDEQSRRNNSNTSPRGSRNCRT